MTDLILVLMMLFGIDRILRFYEVTRQTRILSNQVVNLVAGIIMLVLGIVGWPLTHLITTIR